MKAVTTIEMSKWEEILLGKLVSFEKGRVVATQPYETTGALPYIGAENFGGALTLYTTDPTAVLCEPTDVVMLWDGERSGLCSKGIRGAIGSTVVRLRPRNTVNVGYLYHQLARFFPWIQARRTGTGVPHVPKDLSSILWLPVPNDAKEQCRIAKALDTVDEAIAKTEVVIAKLRQVRAGLLHDLLTRGLDENDELRDPVAHLELFQEPILGIIPRNWNVKQLKDIVLSATDGPFGSNLKTQHYVNDTGVRVIRLQNINSGYFDDTDKAFISQEHAQMLKKYSVVSGDLLVASLGDENHPLARACLYPDHVPSAINKADCFCLRMNPKLAINGFVMLFLNCPNMRHEVNLLGQGVTRDRVNLTTLLTVHVGLPSLDEQQRIVEVIAALDSQMQAEEAYRLKLLSVKSGLMSDFLTGRVRVPEGII